MLRAGYSANADLVIREKTDILLIPERLVLFEDDGAKTFVELPAGDPGGEPSKVEIETGLSDGLNIEVVDAAWKRATSWSSGRRGTSSGSRPMAVSNALRQLWRDVRSQKLRTFLTVFGIVWGTVAVSLLLAFGEGFAHQHGQGLGGPGRGGSSSPGPRAPRSPSRGWARAAGSCS